MPHAQHDPMDELGYRALRSIRRIIRRVSSYSRVLARDTGLTLPQMLCMRAIDESVAAEVTVAGVANAVQLSSSTVSGIIDRLVRAGLVTRERSRVDRRRVVLGLTDSGSALLTDLPRPLQDRFVARLGALDPDDRERVLDGLERVVELMEAEELDAAPILSPEEHLAQKD